jgi:hypothetical protein
LPVLPSQFSRSFSSDTLASALMPLSWVLAVTNGILACSNLLMPTSTRTLVSSQRPSLYSFASPVSPSSFCESSSTQSKRFLTPNTTGKLTWPRQRIAVYTAIIIQAIMTILCCILLFTQITPVAGVWNPFIENRKIQFNFIPFAITYAS